MNVRFAAPCGSHSRLCPRRAFAGWLRRKRTRLRSAHDGERVLLNVVEDSEHSGALSSDRSVVLLLRFRRGSLVIAFVRLYAFV